MTEPDALRRRLKGLTPNLLGLTHTYSARARCRYDRIGGARVLVHEAKREDGVGFGRPRRCTGVAALDVEVGSLFLQVRHVGGADPLHVAPTVSTVTAVARDRLCAG